MAVALCACSNNDVTTPEIIDPQSATLSISTSVSNSIALTRTTATVLGGDGISNGPIMGTQLPNSSNLGIFVTNEDISGAYPAIGQNTNNIMCTSNGISLTLSNSFHLTSASGKVLAYFPYSENANSGSINVKAGTTDYLYGVSDKTVSTSNKNAVIPMNHAMSLISFTFKRGTNLNETFTGNVQSITLNGVHTTGTMAVNGGEITPTGNTNNLVVKYFMNGYQESCLEVIPTVKDAILGSSQTNEIPMFHVLAIPTLITDGTQTATIVIDGATYTISNLTLGLNGGTTNANGWEKGKRYTYNLTVNSAGTGNELVISSVTVNQWQEGGSSDIEI